MASRLSRWMSVAQRVNRFFARVSGGGTIAQGPGAIAAGEGAIVVKDSGDVTFILEPGSEPGAGRQELRQAYLASLYMEANQLPLFGANTGGTQIQLASVYTALLTGRTDGETLSRGRIDASGGREHLSALEVLNTESRLVLLGGPGSGKSTFLNFVALSLAGEILGRAPDLTMLIAPPPQEDKEKQPKHQRWDHGALLPVRVVLRDFAAQLPAPGKPIGANTLWEFIRRQLEQQSLAAFADHLQAELLEQGGLVLLDGLDEVPEADRRREQVKQAVQTFAATYGACRFAVTSRTYAYQRQDWKLDGFAEVQLLPFTRAQVHAFVDAWYAHMVGLHQLSQAEAQARAQRLKQQSDRNERIRELTERPLLLTLIAKLQTERGGELPEKREELYDRAVDMLLGEWEKMKLLGREADGTPRYEPSLTEFLQIDRGGIRMQLNRLAFEAHRDQQELRGTADIAKNDLLGALLDADPQRQSEMKLGLLEQFLRDRSGLLVAHGVGWYQFPHRSFQEYLAACHLTDHEFPDALGRLLRADPNRWREVTLLAGAKAERGLANSVWQLAEELCPSSASADSEQQAQWGALLAGQLLAQRTHRQRVAERDRDKLERVQRWQVWLLEHGSLPWIERALAGRTLAALGDPRREVIQLDHMQFCFVPAGPFVMGCDDQYDEEKPQHTVDLPYAYFIARFPVSVAQWREYLLSRDAADASGNLHGRENDPVVEVNWHDALRFCNALTERWRSHLPMGWVVTPPSEAEWEKAARGGEQIPVPAQRFDLSELGAALAAKPPLARNPEPRRVYPCGNSFESEHGNAAMSIGETSALGCFAGGRSPYGCEELSGNVWEWTRSLWGERFSEAQFKYPYDPNDPEREHIGAPDRSYRVLRGGAFYDNLVVARCAFRDRLHPDYRHDGVGFRVVLRGPPVM